MFERTNNRDEEHVDERAYKFFSSMYGWNSTKEGIRETTTLTDGSTHICAYCGRMALPIQGERWDHSKIAGCISTRVIAVFVERQWTNWK
ncbi:hypothetical protein EXT67_20680 [Pectobacterium atrosepticum]|uniref:hypothetical protein n=1 Tax=Pectobacterium atrosepticum TaxID=29471 RepID=UPI00201B3ADC|nr:hypothetical protein [Pectobacterium atrosepticum]MCL6318721.1 hypothetical protein [Pectobacterium atrosepticum]